MGLLIGYIAGAIITGVIIGSFTNIDLFRGDYHYPPAMSIIVLWPFAAFVCGVFYCAIVLTSPMLLARKLRNRRKDREEQCQE